MGGPPDARDSLVWTDPVDLRERVVSPECPDSPAGTSRATLDPREIRETREAWEWTASLAGTDGLEPEDPRVRTEAAAWRAVTAGRERRAAPAVTAPPACRERGASAASADPRESPGMMVCPACLECLDRGVWMVSLVCLDRRDPRDRTLLLWS